MQTIIHRSSSNFRGDRDSRGSGGPRGNPFYRTRRSLAFAGAILAGSSLGIGSAQAEQDALGATVNADTPTITVWEVDMSGRPPYRRTQVEVPVVDVAALETPTAGTTQTMTVWEVDRRGKPPFSRRQVEVPVVDAAALETLEGGEADAAEKTAPIFRGRPPFRRHR